MDPQIPAQTTQPEPLNVPAPQLPEKPKTNNIIIILFSVLLILLLGATGFLYYQNMNLQKQILSLKETPTPVVSPTPDPTIGWNEYKTSNFSIRVPSNLVYVQGRSDNIDHLVFENSDPKAIFSGISIAGNWQKSIPECTSAQVCYQRILNSAEGAKTESNGKNTYQTITSIISGESVNGVLMYNPGETGPATNLPATTELDYFVENGGNVTYIILYISGSTNDALQQKTVIDQILSTFKFVGNSQTSISNKKIGYIKTIGQNNLTIDYIDYMENNSAPNGFTINNPSTETTTLPIGTDPAVIVQTYSHASDGNFNFNQSISFSEFLNAFNSTPSVKMAPYWIETTNGIVTKITEQYVS